MLPYFGTLYNGLGGSACKAWSNAACLDLLGLMSVDLLAPAGWTTWTCAPASPCGSGAAGSCHFSGVPWLPSMGLLWGRTENNDFLRFIGYKLYIDTKGDICKYTYVYNNIFDFSLFSIRCIHFISSYLIIRRQEENYHLRTLYSFLGKIWVCFGYTQDICNMLELWPYCGLYLEIKYGLRRCIWMSGRQGVDHDG